MQKHALALGYFFLSVFCLLTASFVIEELRFPLLVASLAALLMGGGFLCSAFVGQIRACWKWLVEAFREAQQPPAREPLVSEERSH